MPVVQGILVCKKVQVRYVQEILRVACPEPVEGLRMTRPTAFSTPPQTRILQVSGTLVRNCRRERTKNAPVCMLNEWALL